MDRSGECVEGLDDAEPLPVCPEYDDGGLERKGGLREPRGLSRGPDSCTDGRWDARPPLGW